MLVLLGAVSAVLLSALSVSGLFNAAAFGHLLPFLAVCFGAALALSSLLSAVFESASELCTVLLALFIATYCVFVASAPGTLSRYAQLGLCLLPPFALQLGASSFEDSYRGVSLFEICAMLVLDTVLLSLLSLLVCLLTSDAGLHSSAPGEVSLLGLASAGMPLKLQLDLLLRLAGRDSVSLSTRTDIAEKACLLAVEPALLDRALGGLLRELCPQDSQQASCHWSGVYKLQIGFLRAKARMLPELVVFLETALGASLCPTTRASAQELLAAAATQQQVAVAPAVSKEAVLEFLVPADASEKIVDLLVDSEAHLRGLGVAW